MKSVIKDKDPHSNSTEENYTGKSKGFSFKLYGAIVSLLVGTVAGINWLIDPLWYTHGNILTGKNFAFNERITKSNLFLRTKDKVNYDCIILGSSRTIGLKASAFIDNRCFNYSLKGGEIEDFIDYSQFLYEEGLKPKKVYIGVDGLNFVEKPRFKREKFDITSVATPSPFYAYFSTDVLMFSVMTLLGLSPDPGNYYDRDFQPVDFDNPPAYNPDFYKPQSPQKCDLSIAKEFADLRKYFPEAEIIGYVPPRSAWSIVNDTYGRNLTPCEIQAFYQISQAYDVMYDFSMPSEITKDTKNTYDGSHYSVKVNDKIAEMLEGKPVTFGIRMDNISYEEYRQFYLNSIKQFLAENNQMKLWREQ